MFGFLEMFPKLLWLVGKNVRRGAVRSVLTALGTMALVLVVVLVWSVLAFLDRQMSEKTTNLKAIVTERWQIPSQMPFAYADSLSRGAAKEPGDILPSDSMTWQFYGGTIDPKGNNPDMRMFAFALEPSKLLTMMDELDSLPDHQRIPFEEVVHKLERNRQGIILGKTRLEKLNKRVGDRIKITSINYKEIDLEFEIVGLFPEGRYDASAAFDCNYLNAALEQYAVSHNGQKHPLYEKSLNLVWLRLPDQTTFHQVAQQIENAHYSAPAVKCETASSGIATFLESYRDLLWGIRWMLVPACLASLSLVIANAISIGVRERRLELAVLKVLGYRPGQIMFLVLAEALLLGATAGLLTAGATYYYVNSVQDGLKFPIAFFGTFYIPSAALWWGPTMGAIAAAVGAAIPAWNACRVKVTDVFSRVA